LRSSARHLLNIHRIARRQVCPCIEQDFIKHYLDESLDDVDIEKACQANQLAKKAVLGG
jgi:transposase